MRSIPSLSRSALVTAAAAVLLTACGGGSGSGSEETAESTSADTSSSAAPSTGSSSASSSTSDDPAVPAFCAQAAQYEALGNQLSTATPDQLPGLLQQAATAYDSVQPPAEIAGDWQVVGDALQSFADSASSIDLSAPDGQTQLQNAAQQFLTVAQGPEGTHVSQFVETNCGDSAAPTS
jgi:hypothetical protein